MFVQPKSRKEREKKLMQADKAARYSEKKTYRSSSIEGLLFEDKGVAIDFVIFLVSPRIGWELSFPLRSSNTALNTLPWLIVNSRAEITLNNQCPRLVRIGLFSAHGTPLSLYDNEHPYIFSFQRERGWALYSEKELQSICFRATHTHRVNKERDNFVPCALVVLDT